MHLNFLRTLVLFSYSAQRREKVANVARISITTTPQHNVHTLKEVPCSVYIELKMVEINKCLDMQSLG